jgi:two-component system, OmpR family, aerobic respiration control sensor histidine kinase ArcB
MLFYKFQRRGDVMSIHEGIVDVLPFPMAWFTKEGTYLGCNRSFLLKYSWQSYEQGLGKRVTDIYHDEKEKHISALFSRVALSGSMLTEQLEFQSSSGFPIFVTVVAQPFQIKDYPGSNILITQYDNTLITMDHNNSLRTKSDQQQIFFDNLLNNTACCIFWKNVNGVFLGSNIAHTRLAGFDKPEELIGKTDLDCAWKDAAEKIFENEKKMLAAGHPIVFEEKSSCNKADVLEYLSLKSPLRDAQGNIIGIMGISIEITAQKRAEQALRADKERAEIYLQNVMRHLPGSVYWKDKTGAILGDNLIHAQIAGYHDPNEVVGKTDYDFPWKGEADQIRANDLEVMNAQKSQSFEEIATLPDGTKHCFLTTKIPLLDKIENVIGVLGISVDISDRKEMESQLIKAKEQAEVANKAKTAFIANMGHDIRTPLSGITYIGEVALPYIAHDPELVLQQAEELTLSGQCLFELFEGILQLMTAESLGETQFHYVNFAETIKKVVHLLVPTARKENLKLTMKIDPELPAQLLSNELYVHRIVLNLLGNALKFTKKGGVTVSALMQQQAGKVPSVLVEVEDTGPGIPSEQHSAIFDRFTRLDPSYRGNFKGAGLGLYIVKQYVDALNGEIYVESEVGKGTKFTCVIPIKESLLLDSKALEEKRTHLNTQVFASSVNPEDHPSVRLPLLRAQQKAKQKKKSSKKLKTATQQRRKKNTPKVLLVEDVKTIRENVARLLDAVGFTVDAVGSGEEAVSCVKKAKKPYALVVMDFGLPGISGYEATQQIRAFEIEKKREHIPIVGHTAHASEQVQGECLGSGMDMILHKPMMEDAAKSLWQIYVTEENVTEDLDDVNDANEKSADNDKIIDVERSNRITKSQQATESFLKEVAESLPSDKQSIDEAYQQKDWQALRHAAHRLHGVLCYTGIPQLKKAVKAVELSIDNKTLDLVPTLYDEFVQQYDRFFIEYAKWLGEKRG